MVEKQSNNKGLIVSVLIVSLLALLLSSVAVFKEAPAYDGPNAEDIAALVVLPEVNDTDYVGQNILDELNKDDLWDDEAVKIAEADLRNKDIYRFLDIDKDNFDEFRVLDSDVLESDEEDEDAVVWLKLRAYFYDEDEEDDARDTVYALVFIEDGEAEEFELNLEDDF